MNEDWCTVTDPLIFRHSSEVFDVTFLFYSFFISSFCIPGTNIILFRSRGRLQCNSFVILDVFFGDIYRLGVLMSVRLVALWLNLPSWRKRTFCLDDLFSLPQKTLNCNLPWIRLFDYSSYLPSSQLWFSYPLGFHRGCTTRSLPLPHLLTLWCFRLQTKTSYSCHIAIAYCNFSEINMTSSSVDRTHRDLITPQYQYELWQKFRHFFKFHSAMVNYKFYYMPNNEYWS